LKIYNTADTTLTNNKLKINI